MRLAELFPRGFVAHTAYLNYPGLGLGRHVFVGDRVVLSVGGEDPGPIILGDHAKLFGDTFIQTGSGGVVKIGQYTHVQPGCHFRAFLTNIEIGDQVEIASGCAFYSFDHSMKPGQPITEQPLVSKGSIRIGNGAWLGHGVTVLSGVSIGDGAVIAAGAVVNQDVPANAIAGGVPARILKHRESLDAPV
ncbi:MAG: acyltransferase [Phycisphaeraceae bacterium]|nr:acyltransferase [Phycisphaeraceae bacterium]